jgi:CHAD domain-containing protein
MPLDSAQIQKSVRKLRKLLKRAPKRPTPDQVHDFRTHTRRFEATLEALALDSKRNERRLLRDLARLRKRAGKVRDMDVLTGHTSSLHVDKEEDCQVQLLEYLGSTRYRHAKKLSLRMRENGPAVRRRLKRSAARLEKLLPEGGKNSSNGRTKAAAEAATEAAATALTLSRDLENPAALNKNNLHPYRLKVKELRDVLQLTDDPEHHEFLDALGEVKDAIGEWHDWEELIAIAADQLDHGPGCKLPHELKQVSARKYERALGLANKVRRVFLGAGRARKHPSPGKHGLPRPVLEATAAIAS